MLYVGIDWAEKAHRVCIRDNDTIHAEFEVPNSPVGVAELLKRVAAIEPDKRNVLFAIEATQGPFVEAILDAGYTIYPSTPRPSNASGTGSAWPAPRPTASTPASWLTYSVPTARPTNPSGPTAKKQP